MSISTQNLTALPDIQSLRTLLQSLATLDAIMSRDWSGRYYSFDSHWAEGEMMGSMTDGCGNELFAHFNGAGCLIKGFDHESPMSPYRVRPPKLWDGLLDNVPSAFSSSLKEPAFSMENVTFCIWRTHADPTWSCGPITFPAADDPDGSASLLQILNRDPDTYRQFADEYYEKTVTSHAISHVYDHQPVDSGVIRSLNPDATLEEVTPDLTKIGYPTDDT